MSVIRVNKNKDYSVISNYHLRDKNLSLKGKGLLSVMLSLPEDWNYTLDGLVAICKENETTVNTALKELKSCGYLIVKKLMPNETQSGRIEYIYDIYETPKQEIEKQDLESLGVEFLGVESQGQSNTNKLNTNILNTNKEIIRENIKKENEQLSLLENDGEIENNILNYWNSKDIIKHRQLTSDITKAIQKVLKENTEKDVCDAIDRYNQVLKDKSYFFEYKWTLVEFLTRKNGWKEFLDNGSKWINYVNSESGKQALNKIVSANLDISSFLNN